MTPPAPVSIVRSRWVACLWIEQVGIAVEQARLPHLEGEPFALADAEGNLKSVSDEAATWGARRGMDVQGARTLCAELIVLPYDTTAYEVAARSVWDMLATESHAVEPVTPELSYAEVYGTQTEVTSRLRELAKVIAPRVGVRVGIGIGCTKFVARQAAHSRGDNEDKVVTIPLGEEAMLLAGLPISLLPNAPKLDVKAKQQIERLGVKTLGDIWALPPHRLPKSLRRAGHQLLQWAQGYDSDRVRAVWPPRLISAEAKFDNGLENRFLVENVMSQLAEQVSCSLSATHDFCRGIRLRVGLEDRTWVEETERLATPESQVQPIYRAAMRLLQKLQIEQPVVSLEIIASEIGTGSGVQLSLMDKAGELPHERMKRLESILVHLRREYGPRAVIPAALLAKARRIHLWTHPLGHLLCEPLERVATDSRGAPVRYWRRGKSGMAEKISRHEVEDSRQRYEVLTIHNRWRETGTRNGVLTDADVWRVETDPFGISELRRLDTEWRITASWD